MANLENKKNVQALNEEELNQVTGGTVNNDYLKAVKRL